MWKKREISVEKWKIKVVLCFFFVGGGGGGVGVGGQMFKILEFWEVAN